jgi:rhodanese-related sulfurtransferase
MIRSLCAAIFFATTFCLATLAQAANDMAPQDAWAAMQNNELVLVDVRQQTEWRASGVAPGAVTLTMGSKGFYEKLDALAAANPGKTIGLICAAGGRSTRVANELEKRGLTNVVDIKAGMMGSMVADGWIESGLPVEPWKTE